jgi:protease-4
MLSNKPILSSIFILFLISVCVSFYQIASTSSSKSSKGLFGKEGTDSAYLLKIEGEIHSGKSTYSSTGADTVLAKIKEISSMDHVKGVVVEINSPGGTVAASQEIFEELMVLREKKKIVVTMKDLAASGGYYIAAAAHHIYAEAGTITGSIGVITMSPNISGLMEKYNVKMNVYKQGKYKDILSMFRNPTEEELEIINDLLSDTYKRFVSDVARGRNKNKRDIEKAAQGRIFSGEAAVKVGLVDEIGGRAQAIKKLSELCEYEGNLPLIEEEGTPFDRFFEILGSKMNKVHFWGKEESILAEQLYRNPVLLILPSAVRY